MDSTLNFDLEFRTIGEFAERGMTFNIECKTCGHRAMLPAAIDASRWAMSLKSRKMQSR